MALSVKVGSFDPGSGTGNKSVTGVGFQPKALILFSVAPAAAGFQNSYWQVLGFVTATEAYSVATYSANAADTSNTSRKVSATALGFVVNDEGAGPTATLSSFDSDGFTLNFSTNPWNAYVINYIALGGSDLANAKVVNWESPATANDKAVTGVGFKPDCVLHASIVAGASPTTTTYDAHMMFGAMDKNGNQWANSFAAQDNAATSNTGRIQRTNKCIADIGADGSTTYNLATFVTMDSDGFTVNFDQTTSGTDMISLCLRGPAFKVGSFTTRSGTGSQSITGVGFTPKGLLTSTYGGSSGTAGQVDAAWGVGAASGVGAEKTIALKDLDNQATTSAQGYQADKVFSIVTTGSTVLAEADLDSFDADGFTQTYTTETEGGTRQVLYIAMGDGTDTVAVGQATETDAALSVGHYKVVRLGLATETDSTFGVTSARAKAVGLATETDSALSISVKPIRLVGQASETNSALSVRPGEFHGIGIAAETDSALSVTPTQWVFYPPTVNDVGPTNRTEYSELANARAKFFQPHARGRNVVKESGVYTTVDTVPSSRLEAADLYYLGGHRYVVSAAERAALVAAGYTVTLEEIS